MFPSNAGDVGLTPGQGGKIPHALWPKNQIPKQKQRCSKFNTGFETGPHQRNKRIRKGTAGGQRGGHLNCVQLGSSLLSVDVTYRVTLVWCEPAYITIDVLFPTSWLRHTLTGSSGNKQFKFFQNFYMHAKLLQSYPDLCDPTDCIPPGSSVHGILQARILKWVAMPSSRGSS